MKHATEGGEGLAEREAVGRLAGIESVPHGTDVCRVQRASIVIFAFEGRWNQEIATQVGLNPLQVGTWRQRESLFLWEFHAPRRLREAPVRYHSHWEVLTDAPRPGSSGKMTAEQVAQIIALACEKPKLSGRLITRWTLDELRDEAIQWKIVPTISRAQIGHYTSGGLE